MRQTGILSCCLLYTSDEQGITYNIEGVIFKDTDGDAIIDYMYITRSTIMPQQWIKARCV